MKAIIDKDGYLEILRGNTIKPQKCPFTASTGIDTNPHSGLYTSEIERIDCGDWCPLFGEPLDCADCGVRLTLCHKTLIIMEFEDEREKDKNQD
jgi:hypothetical protein